MLKKRILPMLITFALVISSVGIPTVFATNPISMGDVLTLLSGKTVYDYNFNNVPVGDKASQHKAAVGDIPRIFSAVTDIDNSGTGGNANRTYNGAFTIAKEGTTDNNVLLLDLKYGLKKISAENRALCTKTLTYSGKVKDPNNTNLSKDYTYYVIPESKTTDERGTWYRGYRSDNTSLWCGVYVKSETDDTVDPEKVYSYGGSPHVLEDGSPLLLADLDGRARASEVGFYQQGSRNAIKNGGISTISMRFAMNKYDGEGKEHPAVESEFAVAVDGCGYNFNKSGLSVKSNGNYAQIKRADGTYVEAPKTSLVGKTADTRGIFGNTDNLESIVERKPGEWVEVMWVFERESDTVTLYYNGKPVFWKVSKSDEPDEYSSIIKYVHGTAVPNISVYTDRIVNYVDQDYMIDDIKITYISPQHLAEGIIASIADDYNKVANSNSGLIFEKIGDYVTYSTTSNRVEFNSVDKNIATVKPLVGDTEEVTVTATVAVTDFTNTEELVTATETYTIALEPNDTYEVNAVNVVKGETSVFAPTEGAVVESVNISKNTDEAAKVFVASYGSDGAVITLKAIDAATGDVSVNLDLTGAADYKVFVLGAGSLKPYTEVVNTLPAAGQAVKMFVLGGADLGDSFEANVTIDDTYNAAGAKEALKNGGLDNALTNGSAGDYVVIALSQKDIANATVGEYGALLTQIVKAVQNDGMIPVIVTNDESASYVAKAGSVAKSTGAVHVNGTDIAAQLKAQLLPIAKYVK